MKVLEKEDLRLKINEDLLNFTLTGLLPRGMEIYSADPNPKPSLFTDQMWKELQTLTAFDCFEQLLDEITKNLEAWEKFMSAEKDKVFELMPEPF